MGEASINYRGRPLPRSTAEPGWTPVVVGGRASSAAVEPARSPQGRQTKSILNRFVSSLVTWRERERLRREFMLLGDASLRDIGIDRAQIRAFVGRAARGPARRSMSVTRPFH